MKTTLSAVALVVALSLTAAAANTKKPAKSQHLAGTPGAASAFTDSPSPAPPSLCHPCLFYGGDINTADLNAAGLSDENTLLLPGGSSTYGAVDVPVTSNVFGIMFNIQADAAFDPMTATYDIRQGVSEGNGGTEVQSGSGAAVVQATGRNFLGLNEYTVEVSWSPAITLTPGTYWFNVTPECLNTLDGSCNVFRQFASNSQLANNLYGSWQPIHEMYLNSTYFGITWSNWCDSFLGLNSKQCAGMSFALRGAETK
ncbi:MAG: hypothetical protein ABSF59_14815 [Candidatus Sulfotelmatobacter sp.]